MKIESSNQPETLSSEDVAHVLLIGPGFTGGGAERRFGNIAAHLFGGKADTAVLVTGQCPKERTTGNIIYLNWSDRWSYLKVVRRLRYHIKLKRYDVAMAFGLFPNIISVLAILFTNCRTKLIISEITRPKKEAQNNTRWRVIVQNVLRKTMYRKSYLITANSIDGLRETCELVGISTDKGMRVVNAVNTGRIKELSREEINTSIPFGKYIVSLGRLDYMKRIDSIIDALEVVANQLECKLVIVGDGEARNFLEEKVVDLGLNQSIIFTGKLTNPFPILKKASAFILASEYEGYSNSLLEAMFCDVPVITSLCSSDAYEMCKQRAALGFDIGDVEELARHIKNILTDETVGQNLVLNAQAYRVNHSLEQAIPFYEDLISGVVTQTIKGHKGYSS